MTLGQGAIGRLRCPPQTALSLPVDLAGASTQGIFVLCVLTGDIDVAHAGDGAVARRGDIATFAGAMPTTIATKGQALHDIVMLEVSAARCSVLRREVTNGALRLVRQTSESPLAGCMRLLADHIHAAPKDELTALYEACVSLLAMAASRFDPVAKPEPSSALHNPLLRSILDYANRNLADGTLGAPDVAQRFGISVRYLHKLFAASGTTFGAYVAMRRLDCVRSELISGAGDAQSIAALAKKWGFHDISAFNRAFRKRFGCPPRSLRARIAS